MGKSTNREEMVACHQRGANQPLAEQFPRLVSMIQRHVDTVRPCYDLIKRRNEARNVVASVVLPSFSKVTSAYFNASLAADDVLSTAYAAISAAFDQCIVPLATTVAQTSTVTPAEKRVLLDELIRPAYLHLYTNLGIQVGNVTLPDGEIINRYYSEDLRKAKKDIHDTQSKLVESLTDYVAHQNWAPHAEAAKRKVAEAKQELEDLASKAAEAEAVFREADYLEEMRRLGDASRPEAKRAHDKRIARLEAQREILVKERQELAKTHGKRSKTVHFLWWRLYGESSEEDNSTGRGTLSEDIQELDTRIEREKNDFTKGAKHLATLVKVPVATARSNYDRAVQLVKTAKKNYDKMSKECSQRMVQALAGDALSQAGDKDGLNTLHQFFESSGAVINELNSIESSITMFMASYKDTALGTGTGKFLSPAVLVSTLKWFVDGYCKAEALKHGKALVLTDEDWMSHANDIICYTDRCERALKDTPGVNSRELAAIQAVTAPQPTIEEPYDLGEEGAMPF
eukprot:GHVU01048629.1.p1 GENE.GHVU01048629.1~~GHVU01048629.1.p1  ORF type:complete len:567 (+),score=91.01 GHVU01048629.1:158-1702(+)